MGDQIFASLLTIELSNNEAQVTFRAKIPMACFSLSFFIALDHCAMSVLPHLWGKNRHVIHIFEMRILEWNTAIFRK